MKVAAGMRTMPTRFMGDGLLVLDKPAGCTSHELVRRVKKVLGAAKVGHGGTLDPFATGVLILLVNQATKLSYYLAGEDKSYRFTLVFGAETDTLDSTGKAVARYAGPPLSEEMVRETCSALTGEVELAVPRYSAVRVGGVRLYRLARRGVPVKPPTRRATIRSLVLFEFRWPEATFETTCSKGTYIRSLGAEIGRRVTCGAHVSELRRLRSGAFALDQALTPSGLAAIVAEGRLDQVMIPLSLALRNYPDLRVSHLGARQLRQGVSLGRAEFLGANRGRGWPEGLYRVLDPDDQLVALVARSSKEQTGGENAFETLRVFGAP
jgi:tRNA pseudouridine55 synthase